MDSMGRLAAGVIFLPLLYAAATRSLKKEKGKPAVSLPEVFVLLSGEAAVAAAWLAKGDTPWFPMAVLMTAFMPVFCMTDYWERIVPNRLLLILLFLLILYLGFLGIRDMDAVMGLLVPMVLGFVFCAVSFGLGYLLSHGSMGAGDVKLFPCDGAFPDRKLRGGNRPLRLHCGGSLFAGAAYEEEAHAEGYHTVRAVFIYRPGDKLPAPRMVGSRENKNREGEKAIYGRKEECCRQGKGIGRPGAWRDFMRRLAFSRLCHGDGK